MGQEVCSHGAAAAGTAAQGLGPGPRACPAGLLFLAVLCVSVLGLYYSLCLRWYHSRFLVVDSSGLLTQSLGWEMLLSGSPVNVAPFTVAVLGTRLAISSSPMVV